MGYKSKIPFSIIRVLEKLRGGYSLFRTQYPLDSDQGIKPFFIVGCGRSGNTLLRAMLNVSQELVIPPESYVLPRIIRKFIANNYLQWPELSSLIISEFAAFKEFYTWETNIEPVIAKASNLPPERQNLAELINLIFDEYSLYRGNDVVRWGDKTPKNAEFLSYIGAVFPDAQYIHLIRDPRAVFLSYMKTDLGDEDPRKKNQRIIDFWNACHKQIERCKNKFGNEKFITVHYEHLVTDAEQNLQSICDFLNVEYQQQMLEFYAQSDLGDVNYHLHHAMVLKPLNSSGKDRWKSELSQKDINFVEAGCLKFYQQLKDAYPGLGPSL